MSYLPRPWLFFLLALPQGVYVGLVTTALPWMLREAGISVDRIATAVAIITLPPVAGFVLAPLIDIGLHRRAWLIVGAGTSAAALLAMLLPLPSGFALMTILLTLGSALNTLCSSALGGLMAATLHAGRRGRASGWFQAGNVGGGAIGGGVTLALLQNVSIPAAAIVGALTVFLPSLAGLAIGEGEAPVQPSALRRLKDALMAMALDKRAHYAMVFFLSPVGACAFSNLFTAVADDYRASPGFVTLVTGFGGGLVTMAGALLGGVICDRMERRRADLLVGAIGGAVALGMLASPLSPMTYGVGTVLYSLTYGMSWTAFNALALDIVGRDRGTGATRYAILYAAGYVPSSYMTWADGQGYARFGPAGLLGVDGLATLLVAALLYLWLRRTEVGVEAVSVAS